MKLILFLDERDGMLFCGRRQSKDRIAREYIANLARGARLYMNEFSAKQFEEGGELTVVADPQSEAGNEDFVLIENLPVSVAEVDTVYLFLWNRHYPASVYFDRALLSGFTLAHTEEFAGSSHEKITVERYEKV
ncbi:MAG: ribonuclease Z [Clostridia bacterium]|nr:ribonuclease Z [Clostridia bacterium]